MIKLIAAEQEGGESQAFDIAEKAIPTVATVRSWSGDPQEHFNFDKFEDEMVFGTLVDRWQRNTEVSHRTDWELEIYHAIAAAVCNIPERSMSRPFLSLVKPGPQWLLPLISRFRIIPYEEIYEFDVLFCRIGTSVAESMIDVETELG